MPEGRMLKKCISDSKSLGNLKSDSARLLYTWLIPHLDIEGRHSADPEIIKGHIVPKIKPMTSGKIKKLLIELANENLIILYKANGEIFLQLEKFQDHQKLDSKREAASKIQAPSDNSRINHENSGVNHENSPLSKVKISKINESKEKAEIKNFDSLFEDFWKNYPREGRVERKTAHKKFMAIAKAGKLDELKRGFCGYMDYLKHRELNEGFKQRAKDAKTFLNHYDEFLGFKYEPKL